MRTAFFLSLALLLTACVAGADWEWCLNADFVHAEVDGSTIIVHHDHALYNCCPVAIEYDVDQYVGFISVVETEILDEICPCMCCYNLFVEILNVPPGDYEIDFAWRDTETGEIEHRLLHVTVPELRQEGDMVAGESGGVDCLMEPTSSVASPDDAKEQTLTWGTVKTRYR